MAYELFEFERAAVGLVFEHGRVDDRAAARRYGGFGDVGERRHDANDVSAVDVDSARHRGIGWGCVGVVQPDGRLDVAVREPVGFVARLDDARPDDGQRRSGGVLGTLWVPETHPDALTWGFALDGSA